MGVTLVTKGPESVYGSILTFVWRNLSSEEIQTSCVHGFRCLGNAAVQQNWTKYTGQKCQAKSFGRRSSDIVRNLF